MPSTNINARIDGELKPKNPKLGGWEGKNSMVPDFSEPLALVAAGENFHKYNVPMAWQIQFLFVVP